MHGPAASDADNHVIDGPLPVVDLAAMPESHDHGQEHIIGNGVDDAVVADAHPVAGATSQGSGRRRPRVVDK